MRFRHSGDYGDIIEALPVLQEAKNGPHSLFLVDRPDITNMMSGREHGIIPLLQRQPYIKECRMGEDVVDIDFCLFRQPFHKATITLLDAQRNYVNSRYKTNFTTRGAEPWLHNIEPSPDSKDRVVIARSFRYNNHLFHWDEIVKHYGPRLLFIGLPEEHERFVAMYGPVEHRPTKDLLEVAQVIKGSSLFIGNQSSPLAVAEGMKHPRIAEICLGVCDVIFKCPKAQWVADGACLLPDVAGSGEKYISSKLVPMKEPHEVNIGCPPPCGWWYGEIHGMSLRQVADRCIHFDRTKDRNWWRDEVLKFTMAKYPEHFKDDGKMGLLGLYQKAMQNAGY